jgi:hypothetical protein
MSWFRKGAGTPEDAHAAQMAQYRQDAWAYALERNELPEFVEERLKAASDRKVPWLSTMTPAELLLGKTHGVRPLATVSGTCWFHFGMSWTEGHVDGWDNAIARLKREALAVGANAVVDVEMRTVHSPLAGSMDFTVFGTAVRIDGLPASTDPAIATVSAMDFVRLLEMGITVCGIAVGAEFDYLENSWGGYSGGYNGGYASSISGPTNTVARQLRAFGGNVNVEELSELWQRVRRKAHARLRARTAQTGNGVLARVNFGQLLRVERDKMPPDYLGRQIVIGTVVDTVRASAIPHDIDMVIDMRDELSPLGSAGNGRLQLDTNNEHAGGI